MRVRELIALLKKMDGNAHVVINGTIIADVLAIKGRVGVRGDWWSDQFVRVEPGRDRAVTFMRHAEMSDGTMGLTSLFVAS